MANNVDVAINIGSEFKGKKAFKQADSAVTKLLGNTKKLAGALGLAYGTRAIVNYGKAAMVAAAADQKAQKILAVNLKNVGLAYASVDAESFIKSMEIQTAILDDNLRPAYSQLAQVTGSVTKTQDLMALAFDVSSGSGLDYASTVDILSQAYVGNTKGLKQLNLGLTQAELKSMSFAEIQTKLKTNFAGAGGIALDTYAGSMAKLSVATSNASETIGTALLGALVQVTGSNGVDGLISKIDTLAGSIASVVTQIGNMVGALNGSEAQKAFSPGFIVSGGRAGSTTVHATGAGNMAMSVQSQDLQVSAAAAKKKAELDAIKRNKELAALAKSQAAAALATVKAKKDQVALDKASLALSKGQDVFNLDAIQLNAAMISSTEALGKSTSQAQVLAITNDLARLVIKQDMLTLEDAIAAKDVNAATAAAKKLNADIAILGALNNQALKLVDIKNIVDQIVPKKLIDLDNIDAAILKIIELNRLQGLKVSTTGTITALPVTPVTPVTPTAKGNTDYVAPVDSATAALASVTSILEYADAATARANAMADLLDAQTAAANAAFMSGSLGTIQGVGGTTTLNFNAPIYTVSDAEFAANVQKAIQNNNRFGNNLNYAGAI